MLLGLWGFALIGFVLFGLVGDLWVLLVLCVGLICLFVIGLILWYFYFYYGVLGC